MNARQPRKPSKKQSRPLGLTLDCACVHCDFYQDGIALGPGLMKGHHYFPAFHAGRKKIVQINIYKYLEIEECKSPELENPELARLKSLNKIPYFEKEMFEQSDSENEMISEFPRLQLKSNYCPQCGKFGLQFCLEEHLD